MLILGHRRVSIDKARQLGISTGVLCLIGLWDCIAFPIGETGIFSLDQDEANLMKERVKRLYHSGPSWLHDAWPVAVDKADQFGLQHHEGVSSVECFAASGESGRSRTFRRVIADERARWKRKMGGPAAKLRMAAIRPAVGDVGSLVEVSTADGYDDHYETFIGAVDPGTPVEQGNGYVRLFIGALARPDRSMEWVMNERRILDKDEPGLGAQELPLTWEESFRSSGRCAFDLEVLGWYTGNVTEYSRWRGDLSRDAMSVKAESRDAGNWWVWEWPTPGRDYVVIADPSGGHGADFSAVVVLDRESHDQVAAYHGKIEPSQLAEELVKAGYLWRGSERPALIVPEANNHGQGVVALLREWRYPRLYETEVLDQRTKKTTTTYGWTTTEKTRHIAISALQRGLRERTLGIRDEAAITEMRRFVWVVTNAQSGLGRWEAEAGHHDDRVMTWAIAAAVLAHAESLVARPAGRQQLEDYQPRVSTVTGY